MKIKRSRFFPLMTKKGVARCIIMEPPRVGTPDLRQPVLSAATTPAEGQSWHRRRAIYVLDILTTAMFQRCNYQYLDVGALPRNTKV